jgi:hypothetical protein
VSFLYNVDFAAYAALGVTLDAVIALVLGFIGLYACSMLKKPKKILSS